MNNAASFAHTKWHRAYMYASLALLVGCCAILSYAALFAPPSEASQWIPLLGMLIVFGGYAIFALRHIDVLKFSYTANLEGITVRRDGIDVLSVPWTNMVEIKKYSPLTGMAFIRTTSPTGKYLLLNVTGEANGFIEFAIKRCMEVNDG